LPVNKYLAQKITLLTTPEVSDEEEEITYWHDWEIITCNCASEQLAFEKVDFSG